MIGYFDVAVARDPQKEPDADDAITRRAESILNQYDKDGDGSVQRAEVPLRIVPIFNRLDRDDDLVVTLEELQQAVKNGRL